MRAVRNNMIKCPEVKVSQSVMSRNMIAPGPLPHPLIGFKSLK